MYSIFTIFLKTKNKKVGLSKLNGGSNEGIVPSSWAYISRAKRQVMRNRKQRGKNKLWKQLFIQAIRTNNIDIRNSILLYRHIKL